MMYSPSCICVLLGHNAEGEMAPIYINHYEQEPDDCIEQQTEDLLYAAKFCREDGVFVCPRATIFRNDIDGNYQFSSVVDVSEAAVAVFDVEELARDKAIDESFAAGEVPF